MTYTENYKLNKPDRTDFVNIKDLNDNADAIDAAMQANVANIGILETLANMFIQNTFTTPLALSDTEYLCDDDNKAFFTDWKFKEA